MATSLSRNLTIEEDTLNLPFDIIQDILSRLPVKSLLRFKSVSKPWYSLISDSKFARVHLNQSKNSDSITLYICSSNLRAQAFTFLKFTDQNFRLESLEFPSKKYREANVLCSCDGLVLLKNIHPNDRMWVLWNPSTRTYTKFSCKYWNTPPRSFGLCYDATSDDYKLVLLFSNIRYAIFSYKNNSWIEKEYSLVRLMPDAGQGLFVNGALHWLAAKSLKYSDSYAKEDILLKQLYHKYCTDCGYSHYVNCPDYKCSYNYTYEICCFDPRDDEFKKLSKPSCFDANSVFQLTDLGGQLCLYRKTYNYKMLDIWMMKEYGDCDSWIKLLTIENVPVPHSCKYVKPLCLINKNNIVLLIYGLGIYVYNPKENKICKMHINGAEKWIHDEGMYLTPCLCWNDSLILPTKINRN